MPQMTCTIHSTYYVHFFMHEKVHAHKHICLHICVCTHVCSKWSNKKKHRYFLMCDGHRLAIILQLTQTPLRNLFCTESSLELRLTNIYFNPFSLGLRLTNIVHNHTQSGSSLPKYYSPRFTRTQIWVSVSWLVGLPTYGNDSDS